MLNCNDYDKSMYRIEKLNERIKFLYLMLKQGNGDGAIGYLAFYFNFAIITQYNVAALQKLINHFLVLFDILKSTVTSDNI